MAPIPPAPEGADVTALPVTAMGAAELARRISDGSLLSADVVSACIARCQHVQPSLNAVVATRFDEALREAEAADALRGQESLLPPLHGVPITVKDCFDVVGLPTTLGLNSRRRHVANETAQVVQRLCQAGAIVLAKTNVPQAMLFHECDNPLFGLTLHPENDQRTCGGSSGGEAALIAVGGVPLGCGTDLGGSIRVPAHFCGIHGFKPTSDCQLRAGVLTNLPGMHDIPLVPGPMGRSVEDLTLAYRVMKGLGPSEHDRPGDWSRVLEPLPGVEGLRVGMWVDDGYFTPSPAIQRAVREAGDALERQGAEVVEFCVPRVPDLVRLYFGILGADGGATLRRLLANNPLDTRLRYLLRVARIPGWLRDPLALWLTRRGRHYDADLLRSARALTADSYWRKCAELDNYGLDFREAWDAARLHAALCPPYGLPALRHGVSVELLAAASHTFLANLLNLPAGVVTTTRVAASEETERITTTDPVQERARQTELESHRLPIGVQVLAPPGRDTTVLSIMAAIEPDRLPLPRDF